MRLAVTNTLAYLHVDATELPLVRLFVCLVSVYQQVNDNWSNNYNTEWHFFKQTELNGNKPIDKSQITKNEMTIRRIILY
jgi:hypothetical protein